MFNPIQLTDIRATSTPYSLSNIISESSDIIDDFTSLYTEAVFADGKKKLDSILACITKIKAELTQQIANHEEDEKNKIKNARKFNPEQFWRNQYFKDLEDEIKKVFGFRIVSIQPYIEKYNSKDKTFESKILNCAIYQVNRYPIEGIVTDNGFYDKSNSLILDIYITLGIINMLEPDEILGILLHEMGHSVDPALVSIKYTEMNILAKYLTDRKGAINSTEKKVADKLKLDEGKNIKLTKLMRSVGIPAKTILHSVKSFIFGGKKATDKNIEKIRKLISGDKEKFNKQNFTEAFADNFARMYGYGVPCMRGIEKIAKDYDKKIKSRWAFEKARQQAIIEITTDALKDVHKTDIHRINALIKETEEDLKNPNISATVKKQLQSDIDELKKLINIYTNDFSEFQNRVNKAIYEELQKNDAIKTESFEYNEACDDEIFDEEVEFITESAESKILNQIIKRFKEAAKEITKKSKDEFNKSRKNFNDGKKVSEKIPVPMVASSYGSSYEPFKTNQYHKLKQCIVDNINNDFFDGEKNLMLYLVFTIDSSYKWDKEKMLSIYGMIIDAVVNILKTEIDQKMVNLDLGFVKNNMNLGADSKNMVYMYTYWEYSFPVPIPINAWYFISKEDKEKLINIIKTESYVINEGFFDRFKKKPQEPVRPRRTEPNEAELKIINDIIPHIDELVKFDSIKMITGKSLTKEEDLNYLTASKYGGTPYWPEGVEWPSDTDGKYICLLQINLDDIKDINHKILLDKDFNPVTTGLLQYFVSPNLFQCMRIHHLQFKSTPEKSISVTTFDKTYKPLLKFPMFDGSRLISFEKFIDIMPYSNENERIIFSQVNNMLNDLYHDGRKLNEIDPDWIIRNKIIDRICSIPIPPRCNAINTFDIDGGLHEIMIYDRPPKEYDDNHNAIFICSDYYAVKKQFPGMNAEWYTAYI